MAPRNSHSTYSPGDQNGEFESDMEYDEGHDRQVFPGIQTILHSRTKTAIAIGIIFLVIFSLAFLLLLSVILASSELIPLLHPLPTHSICASASPSTATHTSLKDGAVYKCGKSVAEAKAAGCVFDLMSAAWLPLECFDSELNAEFMELGPWDFYISNFSKWDLREAPEQEKFKLPSVEAIGDSAESLWTDRRFHVTHCIFAWKIMHRAIERGWKMEETVATYHHTEHCSTTLANTSVPLDAIMTRVEMSFPAC